jgi:hypothetical protein
MSKQGERTGPGRPKKMDGLTDNINFNCSPDMKSRVVEFARQTAGGLSVGHAARVLMQAGIDKMLKSGKS